MKTLVIVLAVILLPPSTAAAAVFGDPNVFVSQVVIKDNVCAMPAVAPANGICDSITAYVRFNFDSCKVRGVLYRISGNDTVLVTNGATEERRFATNAALTWQGFAFAAPRPQILAGETYFIALFGDTAGNSGDGLPRMSMQATGGALVQKSANYESGIPTPLNPSSLVNTFRVSIYCTYTPESPALRRRRISLSE